MSNFTAVITKRQLQHQQIVGLSKTRSELRCFSFCKPPPRCFNKTDAQLCQSSTRGSDWMQSSIWTSLQNSRRKMTRTSRRQPPKKAAIIPPRLSWCERGRRTKCWGWTNPRLRAGPQLGRGEVSSVPPVSAYWRLHSSWRPTTLPLRPRWKVDPITPLSVSQPDQTERAGV